MKMSNEDLEMGHEPSPAPYAPAANVGGHAPASFPLPSLVTQAGQLPPTPPQEDVEMAPASASHPLPETLADIEMAPEGTYPAAPQNLKDIEMAPPAPPSFRSQQPYIAGQPQPNRLPGRKPLQQIPTPQHQQQRRKLRPTDHLRPSPH